MKQAEDIVIKTLEGTKTKIAERIAKSFQVTQLDGYSQLSTPQLVSLLLPTLEMIVRYFRTDDTAELKANLYKRVEDRLKRGYAPQDITVAISIIAADVEKAIEEVNDEELDNIELTILKTKYKRRVESIRVLSQLSIVSFDLKKKD